MEPSTPALGRLAAQDKTLLRASAVRQNVGTLARFHVAVGFRTIRDVSGENSGWVTKFVIDSKELWLPAWKTLKIFSPKVSSHRNTGLTGIYSIPHPLGPRVCRCVSGRELLLAWLRRRAQEVRKRGEARALRPGLRVAPSKLCPTAPAPSSLMPAWPLPV